MRPIVAAVALALVSPVAVAGEDLLAVKVMETAQLGETLTDAEAASVTAFLSSLTGRQPRVPNPVLPPSSDATPQPRLEVKPPA
jgi:hypothetical protein